MQFLLLQKNLPQTQGNELKLTSVHDRHVTNHEGNSLESTGMPTILNRDPFLCFWLLEGNENARNWYSGEPFFCQSNDLAVIPKNHIATKALGYNHQKKLPLEVLRQSRVFLAANDQSYEDSWWLP